MCNIIEVGGQKLPAADRNFDSRFLSMIMHNLMFVYDDLVDEETISADDYRAMLVNQIRNFSHNKA
jgi:hypothetical protein